MFTTSFSHIGLDEVRFLFADVSKYNLITFLFNRSPIRPLLTGGRELLSDSFQQGIYDSQVNLKQSLSDLMHLRHAKTPVVTSLVPLL